MFKESQKSDEWYGSYFKCDCGALFMISSETEAKFCPCCGNCKDLAKLEMEINAESR